jgi:uncharacterized protein (TIGR00725 family)
MSLQPGERNLVLKPGTEEALAAIAQTQRSAMRTMQPVGLIGPGDGGAKECDAAFWIASHLAKAGIAIVCGGRSGVMEAAARGAASEGGVVVGLLPEEGAQNANSFLTVAIPTGMGEMRNALIARSCLGLIAVGGGMGTISEMAFGLKIGKPVFSLYEDVQLSGQRTYFDPASLLSDVAHWLGGS